MPLPAMAGDPSTMTGMPGMGGAPPSGSNTEASAQVDPKEQARGAIELTSKIRSFNQDQLEAVATQFPSVAKDAKELMSIIDQGIGRLVKKLISTVQLPEPEAPRIAR